MKHNIAVIGTAFDENHKDRLASAAAATGCSISYYPDNDAAIPHMEDVHIVFGPSDGRSPDLVKAAPNLQWFASYYAGVDPLIKTQVLSENTILTNGYVR